MLWLKTYSDRIQELVDEGTLQSVTYAALEARLAIERVCYERLRIAHDYISPDDIKKWQPRDVVQTIIKDVNPDAAASLTFSISKNPVKSREPGTATDDIAEEEYIEVGRQIGFDPAKIGKLWNALGNFLHVRLPRSKSDDIASYGDPAAVRSKVEEVLVVLRELEKGTLITNGIGQDLRFKCECGIENKRRVGPLKEGQTISCISPTCEEKYDVCIEGDEINLRRRSISACCQHCAREIKFTEALLLNLPRDMVAKLVCHSCKTENFVVWKLMHAKRQSSKYSGW